MDFLDARRRGPVLPSYAQNAEDIRIWRVLGHRGTGFYVDVGAGHPVIDSVTKLFYDNGWSGINVEPGPHFATLAAARHRDVNLDVAISEIDGASPFWVLPHDPDRSSLIGPIELPGSGAAEKRDVRTVRLDHVLREHAGSRPIDFLKIDTEGSERAVLASFDPGVIRPTVLVVEAITPLHGEPSQDDWEPALLDAGYVFAAFDGVNRFYVPAEHDDLVDALAYPISILDRYVKQDYESESHEPVDLGRISELEQLAEATRHELEELRQTLSWRITRPLRILRHAQRRASGTSAHATAENVAPLLKPARRREIENTIAARLNEILSAIPSPVLDESTDPPLASAITRLEHLASSGSHPPEVLSWLTLTAIRGGYPTPSEIALLARLLRTSGPHEFAVATAEQVKAAIGGSETTAHVDLLVDEVIVDVTQIVTTDLHSGIQRVARELVSNWISRGRPLRLAAFDGRIGALKLLDDSESSRIRDWREHLASLETRVSERAPVYATGNPIVPLGCRVLVLEIPEPSHCVGLRSLATSSSIAALGMVCYDLIPIVGPETSTRGVYEMFYDYLPLVKRADRISAISRQSADSFELFAALLDAIGERRPDVRSHPLPTSRATITHADLARARSSLRLTELPLVLVVGVSDERKNHVGVAEAALKLWSEGHRFKLLFIAGSHHSDAPEFDAYARYVRDQGVELQVKRRATEAELWAAYTLARFTVFPSLVEGFGLPIAESLVCGTPAITSAHGAMAEIAAGGGTVTVDPRNIDDLTEQMRRLLTDDELLDRLRAEARSRDFGSWSEYADEVWEYLAGGAPVTVA